MRQSREAAEETRRKILRTAARQFRKHGVDGISIADLMAEAGLTHGGFYKHFASKDALISEACGHAFAGSGKALEKAVADAAPGQELAALVDEYLSPQHRDRPETGCVMAALGSEVGRGDGAARRTMTEGFERIVNLVAAQLRDQPGSQARRRAIAAVAAMVGALTVSRAVSSRALADEILAAARHEVLRNRA